MVGHFFLSVSHLMNCVANDNPGEEADFWVIYGLPRMLDLAFYIYIYISFVPISMFL